MHSIYMAEEKGGNVDTDRRCVWQKFKVVPFLENWKNEVLDKRTTRLKKELMKGRMKRKKQKTKDRMIDSRKKLKKLEIMSERPKTI